MKKDVRMVSFDRDDDLEGLHPEDSIEELTKLISFICGDEIRLPKSPEALHAISRFLSNVKIKREKKEEVELSYEQFNELLLLFNQTRIQRSFFDFFFLRRNLLKSEIPAVGEISDSITFEGVIDGVKVFRGFALLCFGNFRSAFEALSKEKNPRRFMEHLHPWCDDSNERLDYFRKRKPPLVDSHEQSNLISRDETWYLGYLSSDLANAEYARVTCIRGKIAGRSLEDTLKGVKEDVAKIVGDTWLSITEDHIKAYKENIEILSENADKLRNAIDEARNKGKRNTIKYLTWDYMDVYVATSMRYQWDFEETHDVVQKIFDDKKSGLRGLPIRWFDPTQSFDTNPIDKGLLEGLMLKRAQCTIYMVQESDTFGKDSELAATLAQGKPVIAYITKISDGEIPAMVKKFKSRPLKYFRQRLLALKAEVFDKPDNRRSIIEKLRATSFLKAIKSEKDFFTLVRELQTVFDDYFEKDDLHFALVGDDEDTFKKENSEKLNLASHFLAVAEAVAADIRANTIARRHPLSLQVNLETGVANGVLVARSIEECSKLLYDIIVNRMSFNISVVKDQKKQPLSTVLEERETGSRFRVVTKNQALTNSFWNFYLEEEKNKREG